MLRRILVVSLLAVTAAMQETVSEAAAEAAAACASQGAVPHPSDARKLVLCAGPGRLVAVVRCPEGYEASATASTCEPAPSPPQRVRRQARATPPPSALAADPGCASGPGARCVGCDALVVCAAEGGRVRALANVSCSAAGDGLTCDAQQSMCSPASPAAANTVCVDAARGPVFRCLQQGTFPDPDDCQRYHLCEGLELNHFSDTCEIAFDPDKSTCVAEGDTCDPKTSSPAPCTTNAAPAAFPGHQSFYRVCLPQSPKGYRSAVLRCPEQQIFDAKTGSCSYVCETKKTRFPDPLDCHAFFDCPGDASTPTVPKRGACSAGLAYDAKRHMCVQEANVTTCVVTFSANPPTPAAAAAVVAAVTTSKPSSSPADAPGQCTQEGVFPDPYECRRYITCSKSRRTGLLIRTVRYCPLFMSFNTRTRACWFDFCL